MSRKKEMAIYYRRTTAIVCGRIMPVARSETVRVMARAEGYAMVRLPGCNPFIVREKDLGPLSDCGSNERS